MVDGTHHPVDDNMKMPPFDTNNMTCWVGDDEEMRSPGIEDNAGSSPAFSYMKSSPCPSPSPVSARISVRSSYPTPSMSHSPAPGSDSYIEDSIFVLPPLSPQSSPVKNSKPKNGHVGASRDTGSLMTPQDVKKHMDALSFSPIPSRDHHATAEFFIHFKSLNRTMKDAQKAGSLTPEDKTLVIFEVIKKFVKDHALGPISSKHSFSFLERKVREHLTS